MLKHYLLERVVKHYVQNVDEVLGQFSVSSLLWGSVMLPEVELVPEAIQDALFPYVFFGCQVMKVTARKLEVVIDWLSVASKSVQIVAETLELDLVMRDPQDPAMRAFWVAQAARHKAALEALAVPAEATLFYKVLSGLDIRAKSLVVHLRGAAGGREEKDKPGHDLRLCMTDFRYGPATSAGKATTDLEVAITSEPGREEVAYSYTLTWRSFSILLRSSSDESQEKEQEEVGVVVDGFTLNSQGKVPCNRLFFEGPSYSASVLFIEIEGFRAASSCLTLDALVAIVQVLARASASDSLRGKIVGSQDGEGCPSLEAQAEAVAGDIEERGGEPETEPIEDQSDHSAEGLQGPSRGADQTGAHLERLEARREARRSAELLLSDITAFSAAAATPGGAAPAATSVPSFGMEAGAAGTQADVAGAISQATQMTSASSTASRFSTESQPLVSRAATAASRLTTGTSCFDDDEFQDCEEFGVLQVPSLASDTQDSEGFRRSVPDRGLKRLILGLEHTKLEISLPSGAAIGLELRSMRLSTDSRFEFSAEQEACVTALADMSAGQPTPRSQQGPGSPGDAALTQAAGSAASASGRPAAPSCSPSAAPPGIIYAGMTLEMAQLWCSPARQADAAQAVAAELAPRADVARLERGLRLRHRGPGEVALLENGPRQLLEVEVNGVYLQDFGREEVLAVANALSAAASPPPALGADNEKPQEKGGGSEETLGYACSVEAGDVVLEATLSEDPWRCVLPSVHLHTVLRDVDDIWSYAFMGPEVVRGLSEPLGALAVDHVRYSWGEEHGEGSQSPVAESPARRNQWHRRQKAGEVIAQLQKQLEHERCAREIEAEQVRQLRASFTEVLGIVRDWPTGPMPLALRRFLAESLSKEVAAPPLEVPTLSALPTTRLAPTAPQNTPQMASAEGRSSGRASILPGVGISIYELNAGEEECHIVDGLRRGDVLEWSIEEAQSLTVDVTVVIRSPCRLHAARRLRDTIRTSFCRDSFGVTEDFAEAQLPLTLEIKLSNSFSWWAQKRVRVRMCRAGRSLQRPLFV